MNTKERPSERLECRLTRLAQFESSAIAVKKDTPLDCAKRVTVIAQESTAKNKNGTTATMDINGVYAEDAVIGTIAMAVVINAASAVLTIVAFTALAIFPSICYTWTELCHSVLNCVTDFHRAPSSITSSVWRYPQPTGRPSHSIGF